MVILAERWGGPDNNDFIISVDRKELKKHLETLDIPYDFRSRNGRNFLPMVAVFAKLTDNDFANGGVWLRTRYGVDLNALEEIEVTKVGLVKLQNILKQYFKITLGVKKGFIDSNI